MRVWPVYRARQALRSTPPPPGGERLTLTEVGGHYEVGKARRRAWNQKALTDQYEPFLAPLRDRPVRLLELGVEDGRSLRMWKAYFPLATIVGVDRRPCDRAAERRVHIVRGDQADPRTVARAVRAAGGPLDVVCDDGSHLASGQIGALTLLWPHLSPGGLYFVEDIHTSYRDSYQMGWRQPGTTVEFLKGVVDDVHVNEHGNPETLPGLEEIHFFFRLCVLRKRVG